MLNVYICLICFVELILCFPLINTNTTVIVYVLTKNMRIFFSYVPNTLYLKILWKKIYLNEKKTDV